MIIEDIMSTKIITMKATDTIGTAIELIHSNRIRHIPIVNDDDHVIGIISDRDIRDASPSIFHANDHAEDRKRPVSSIMTVDVITGHPLDFVEEVSAIFYEHKIGCLPIESNGRLVGIVTETDMLHTLVKVMGADQPSSLIEIQVENKLGMLAETSRIFSDHNIHIISVQIYPDKIDPTRKILLFRVQTINPVGVIEELKNHGYAVLWPNLSGVSL